jgi:hypothetical protein
MRHQPQRTIFLEKTSDVFDEPVGPAAGIARVWWIQQGAMVLVREVTAIDAPKQDSKRRMWRRGRSL